MPSHNQLALEIHFHFTHNLFDHGKLNITPLAEGVVKQHEHQNIPTDLPWAEVPPLQGKSERSIRDNYSYAS